LDHGGTITTAPRQRLRLFAWCVALALAGIGCESAIVNNTVDAGGFDPNDNGTTDMVEVRDLGSIGLGNPATAFGNIVRESPDLTIDVPANTLSLLFYTEAPEATSTSGLLFFSRMAGPSGQLMFEAGGNTGDLRSYTTMGPPLRPDFVSPGSASIALPGADGARVEAGTYKFRVAGGMQTAHVYVVRHSGPDQVNMGQLDLNLFFVQGSGLSSSDLATLEPALDSYFAIFAQAGIARGRVNTYDITGAAAEELVTVSIDDQTPTGAFRKLMGYSAKGSNLAYNIFFTSVLQSGGLDGFVVDGLTEGVPVAQGVGGTMSSGSVISVAAHMRGATIDYKFMAETMAHETGHGLGLFHSSELTPGGPYDLISDTPQCPASADTNHDNRLTNVECVAYDGYNLMFWESAGGQAVTVSQGQADVLLRAPVVHRR
jgi:hypothetical protein